MQKGAVSAAVVGAQEHGAGFHVAAVGQEGLIIVEVAHGVAVARLRQQQIRSGAADFASADIAFDVDDGMLEIAEIVDDDLAVGREELGDADRHLLEQGEGRFFVRCVDGLEQRSLEAFLRSASIFE